MARPNAQALGAAVPAGETSLLEGVERLDFAYLQSSAAGGHWLGEWNAPDPPAAVRATVVTAHGDGHTWPAIVMVPMRSRAEE
jgi:hypothetical protein